MLISAMRSVKDNMTDSSVRHVSELRSHSAQGLTSKLSNPALKIPLPPRLWITDIEDDSSDDGNGESEGGTATVERSRVRSRYRHHKQRSSTHVPPIGIFWDIENCQVPRGCSAIDVVAAIRTKFLIGRREADFVVVCDVRKEAANRLQELNDSQVSLIHVCGTQKNAADEKLRQCMRRFGELHPAPASLVLISGDINFAADLSDFRHRKNMEVILVHKQNTSSALIACASSHYCYNELTGQLPRNPKVSQTEEDEPSTCEMEVANLPVDQPPERVSRRLRRLADNCGGKVLKVTASTAMLRFPTPDHASRALKRMNGEDVFGCKISTRYVLSAIQPTYSSDEGYSTGPHAAVPTANVPTPQPPPRPQFQPIAQQAQLRPESRDRSAASEWALAIQQLPAPTPPPHEFCPPPAPAQKPRMIRGTHGTGSLDRSGCSSSNSCDSSREPSASRAGVVSPWNSSASFSEHSDEGWPRGCGSGAELTVANLPPYDTTTLQEMLTKLINHYVPVVRLSVWAAGDGPLATVVLRSEADARLAISRVHKRRLDSQWAGRRLELSLGRPVPAPNLDILRARLRAILLSEKNHALPLLRLRDTYASRHSCALTTSEIVKVEDTAVIHEGFGRIVQLVDFTPVSSEELEETMWKCEMHASANTGHEDGSRILQPVCMEMSVLTQNTHMLLDSHGGVLPLLSFVECYEAMFPPLICDSRRGVTLELLLRSIPTVEVKDSPSRHLTWATTPQNDNTGDLSRSSSGEDNHGRYRTAPALEPMLALFERELMDLLRSAPKCCIPFSKLIPAFHHHFGRQCRVADYGFTKLPDLLAALYTTVVVLGSGSYRIITISAAAQSRRWTSDLVKILKAQPGRVVYPHDVPQLYQATIGRVFSPVDYGLCTLGELLKRVSPQAIIINPDGSISLPRQTPTPEERARTLQFAVQAIELLCHTPSLKMEFSRFVPAYHAHFGCQLRVAHYGCVKLVDLMELIPDSVSVCCEPSGERGVRLSTQAARTVMAQRFKALSPVSFSALTSRYVSQYGAPPQPEVLEVSTLEALVYAAGGRIEGGIVLMVDDCNLVNGALAACAVLSADRIVARGSSEEYFVNAYTRLQGSPPDLKQLMLSRVVEVRDRHVRVSTVWRSVWRVAQILCDCSRPVPAIEVFLQYTKRYGQSFPKADLIGLDSVVEFLRHHSAVFRPVSDEDGSNWRLNDGVCLPSTREVIPIKCLPSEDYSIYDTPPGQKGSRVFESPQSNIWCSPPASSLPQPTALLGQDKRRIRLAAQFESA